MGFSIFTRRRQWQPTPVLLPGKSHGWSSLVGCSPWGREEWDTTEQLHFHFSLLCIGEGNGNPLQCSCLENPRDGGAWWAAVYGVTQSRTRLKWLSRSSSSSVLSQAEIWVFLQAVLPQWLPKQMNRMNTGGEAELSRWKEWGLRSERVNQRTMPSSNRST